MLSVKKMAIKLCCIALVTDNSFSLLYEIICNLKINIYYQQMRLDKSYD